jgi:hypothetical protein
MPYDGSSSLRGASRVSVPAGGGPEADEGVVATGGRGDVATTGARVKVGETVGVAVGGRGVDVGVDEGVGVGVGVSVGVGVLVGVGTKATKA